MEPAAPSGPPLRPSLLGGIAAGFVAMLSFHVFHTIWIADVPAVLVEGAVWAVGAGAAVGWAFHHLHAGARYPPDWRGGLLVAGTWWLLLLPYEVVGVVFGPFTHLTRPVELAAIAPSGLLGVPFAALLGWVLARDRRAALALGVAAAAAHFMIGGSIVYFGGRGPILVLFLWMLPTYVVAGLVLVEVRGRLLARPHRPSVSSDPA